MAGMPDPNNKGEGVGFPDMNCDGYASPLRADIHFPSCYNPQAGLTNYKENMVYPSDNGKGKSDCPKGYVHVPHLFLEVYWNTPLFKDRWEQGKGQQPFVLSNGDATGYSSHADFMAGWDEPLLQHIIDTCDAGSGGMDKCPGLTYGLNSGECTIKSPIDEVVGGVLDLLPGNNAVTGWAYGGMGSNGGGDQPQPSKSQSAGAENPPKSTSSKPAGADNTVKPSTTPVQDNKPTSTSKIPDATPTSKLETGGVPPTLPSQPSACSPKTVTVHETVTVTASAPGATNQPSSKSNNTAGGFTYAGCFKDNNDRALNGAVRPNLGPMTNEKCVTHCKSAGFALAGTEYGGQCYCGNELVGSQKLDDSACKVACEGDNTATCGGGWALSVYSKDGEASLKGAKSRRLAHEHLRRHRSR
jgi:hypothetical protein